MRRPLALLLVLAFLAALATPVRASWSCADGSPCVHDQAGYICPGKKCAVHGSCCLAKKVLCKHGALPEGTPRSTRPALEAPDDCRFKVVGRPLLTGVTTQGITVHPAPVAFIGVAIVRLPLPEAIPTWRSEHTLGYRPPPYRLLGPSRAPPPA
jgi:hypothetical protein